jgi:hypothetical protein
MELKVNLHFHQQQDECRRHQQEICSVAKEWVGNQCTQRDMAAIKTKKLIDG